MLAMIPATSDHIHLDHLALASTHAWDQVIRYAYQLGGRWLGGPALDDSSGFYFCQVELEGGAKLEFLEPVEGDGSEFLRRFLNRNGPGPHHLTFKVPDFDAAVAAVSAADYDVIAIDRSDPDWHEGFLHPKQSHGIVIQLAYQGAEDTEWPVDTTLPPALRAEPPVLDAIEHLVADLDAAVALFTGPLAMLEKERGRGADGRYAVVTSGPWRLVLIQPERPDWQQWLGGRSGRVLRLSFEVAEPGTVAGAEPAAESAYEVAPERNLGTRLRLRARSVPNGR